MSMFRTQVCPWHTVWERQRPSLCRSSKARLNFFLFDPQAVNYKTSEEEWEEEEDDIDAVDGLRQNKNTDALKSGAAPPRLPFDPEHELTERPQAGVVTLFDLGTCRRGTPLRRGSALYPELSGCPTSACCACAWLSLPRLPRLCRRSGTAPTPRGRSRWKET